MLLSKDQILNADDLKFEDIDVPEWGGSVRISVMSASDRDSYEASTFKMVGKEVKPDMTNARAKLVSRCAIDEDGKLLFTTAEVEKLGKKSASALDRLVNAARRINGMGEESIEDAVKN